MQAGKPKSQDNNFRLWIFNSLLSIAWNDLGLFDTEAPDGKNFMVAPASFHSRVAEEICLGQQYVSQALPMQASDFDEGLVESQVDFD